ncbi:hypothetical protein Btru_021760 [Bulinus truncatus]|nr:hypothetical protein Btru_021760 [Bulinus truncatus]
MGKIKILPGYANPLRIKKSNFVLSDLWWQFQNSPENGQLIKLFQVIREGNIRELTNLLDDVGDLRAIWGIKDGVGVSALHITVKFDRPEVAEILLKRGAGKYDPCPPYFTLEPETISLRAVPVFWGVVTVPDAPVSRQDGVSTKKKRTYPNVMSLSRGTPLSTACRFNRANLVRLYMKYGADPLLGIPTLGNTLHAIAMYSAVHIANLVFRSIKPPVNSQTELGRTPLHNAAQFGNDDVCQWLLQHGADPKAKCIRRSTPLMMACKYGHVTTMRILIMADRCSLNSPDHLLNEVDDEGNGPLHYAVIDNQIETAQELLQLGCNPNLQNSYLMTPLHICATDGYVQLITSLYDYKAKLDIKELKGKTALHKAVEHNKAEIVVTLLNLGADINIQDNKQFTPLMSASFKGNVDMVSLLLRRGADAGVKNHIGQTCLSVAVHGGQFEALQVLVAESNECLLNVVDLFDQSVLHHASRLKDVRFINLLLQYGCSPHTIDALHEFPLHVAAKYGSYATVKRLVEVTKDINAENFEQKSAFFMACELGNRETIRALIEAGSNVKDTGKGGLRSLWEIKEDGGRVTMTLEYLAEVQQGLK